MSVSVVIPAFNRAHRLPAAIESALGQRHDDLEVIVVDDGSVDDTRAVVARYPGVRYVYQDNRGVGAARNTGIRHATKTFIAFLDSDDRWVEGKLSMQLAICAARPDVGLVFSDFIIERHDGRAARGGAALWAGRDLDFPDMTAYRVARPGPDSPGWPAAEVDYWAGPMYRQLLDELPVLTSSVLVRRSMLDSTTWFTEGVALFEDWEFFARVARRGEVAFLPLATTVNVGHLDPGRVSKCSDLDRAESYRTLLERVWLADRAFVVEHEAAVRSAHARALLAEARESLAAGAPAGAVTALAAYDRGNYRERRGWATVYRICARVPWGRSLLRLTQRVRTVARIASGRPQMGGGAANPAL